MQCVRPCLFCVIKMVNTSIERERVCVCVKERERKKEIKLLDKKGGEKGSSFTRGRKLIKFR